MARNELLSLYLKISRVYCGVVSSKKRIFVAVYDQK